MYIEMNQKDAYLPSELQTRKKLNEASECSQNLDKSVILFIPFSQIGIRDLRPN